MTVLQRGETVAVVVPGVVIVANANKRRVQQMHNGGYDLFARQAAQRHMLPHLGPNARERIGEGDQMLVLGAFAQFAETRMIPILLSSPGVSTCGLDVTVRRRADPNVGPGWRNGERLDAPQGFGGR